jgi:hypothetical protein
VDNEFIKKTIEVWQPYFVEKELRADDATEIISTTTALLDLLNEWAQYAKGDKQL